MNIPTVMVIRPMKQGDPTQYTYEWAEEAIKLTKSYGYPLVELKKDEVTYENVTKAIDYHQPKLIANFSHGCPTSIQGQNECVITRRFEMDELLSMPNFPQIVMPLAYSSGCVSTCKLDNDICNPICTNDTNVGLLSGKIVYAVSCYTAVQLGLCAVKYGADSYIGYNDLLLFPVDEMKSQDLFKSVHLYFMEKILEGKTVAEANFLTNAYEDELIRFYKTTKYVALPLLWNKINRKVLGNQYAKITSQQSSM